MVGEVESFLRYFISKALEGINLTTQTTHVFEVSLWSHALVEL